MSPYPKKHIQTAVSPTLKTIAAFDHVSIYCASAEVGGVTSTAYLILLIFTPAITQIAPDARRVIDDGFVPTMTASEAVCRTKSLVGQKIVTATSQSRS